MSADLESLLGHLVEVVHKTSLPPPPEPGKLQGGGGALDDRDQALDDRDQVLETFLNASTMTDWSRRTASTWMTKLWGRSSMQVR